MAPFAVLHADGSPYRFPFLGGFDHPRPQLLDIDGDGDLDLFVQERTNQLMFFDNIAGPGAEPRFELRTIHYDGLRIGEWFRFADVDRDGDSDLLAEEPFSHIRYFRNDGGARSPRFVLATDTLRDADGEPLFSDRQNIPNLTDIDCDALADLFIGRLTGNVSRYEATDPTSAVPRFRLVTDKFEDISIVNQFVGSAHGANSLDFADVDDDGDQDLFWGDFFEPGLLLIENTGSCESPSLRGQPVPFPPGDPLRTSGFNAPAVADLDGDGDPDILIGVLGGAYNPSLTAADNLYLLERAGAGYRVPTRRFLDQIDVGSESMASLGDLNGDGDLDLLIANKLDPADPQSSRIYWFENAGTPTAPALRERSILPIRGAYHYAPALADLDGDGRPDLLLGTWNDGIDYYRNEGAGPDGPSFSLVDSALITLTRGSNATPAPGDLDGDGDLDLLVGEASGTINFYRNDGTAKQPRFTLVTDELQGIDVGRRSSPALVDADSDGDLDLLVGTERGELVLYRNVGSAQRVEFATEPRTLDTPFGSSTPAIGDLDGDGAPELLLGSDSGGLGYAGPLGAWLLRAEAATPEKS